MVWKRTPEGLIVAWPARLQHVPLLRCNPDQRLEFVGQGLRNPLDVVAELSLPLGGNRRSAIGEVPITLEVDGDRNEGCTRSERNGCRTGGEKRSFAKEVDGY